MTSIQAGLWGPLRGEVLKRDTTSPRVSLVQKHMPLLMSTFLAFPTAHDVILMGSRVHKFPCAACTSEGSLWREQNHLYSSAL